MKTENLSGLFCSSLTFIVFKYRFTLRKDCVILSIIYSKKGGNMKDFEREKLLEIFEDLLLIHSPSKREEKVADYIINFVEELGGEVYLDQSQDK